MSILSFIAGGILIGMLFPIQASISSRLNSYSKTPFTASLIAFALGTILLFIINLLINPGWLATGFDLSYPLYIYIGGAVAGVGFNVVNIILFSKLGASVSTLVTVAGQMIIGIAIDHFGWFGVPENPVRITVVIGALLLVSAIAMSQTKKRRSPRSSFEVKTKLIWIVIGICSGFLPPLQTAINGKLSLATGSPFLASFISFLVGMLILMLLVFLKLHRLEFPRQDVDGKRLPLWVYSAGLFGVFVVTGNVILLPELGCVLTTMVFLLGQMVMALLIDHWGLFRLPKRRIDARRLITLLLMITGILFVKFV